MNKDDLDEINRLLSIGMHAAVVTDVMVSRWNGRWQMSGKRLDVEAVLPLNGQVMRVIQLSIGHTARIRHIATHGRILVSY
ncbi:hypothetical protein NJC38_17185 [Pseudomonas sp. 21LCFQ010]|uniref:hypothetical protein n=1 Tax=Pseudomonas sp. 21LCFQ010 TaxID=2957506 RepID=UPI002097517F|nr:hypothetical protein [Pseudomonas sp. 21LCFQ010]MCO8163890.1 hypothetical protein [Pseudomonas sp. 21LCFQ010]